MALTARLPLRGRLVAYRLALLLALALGLGFFAFAVLASGPGQRPYFLGRSPLPLLDVARLVLSLPPALWGTLALVSALAVVVDMRLSAGALCVLATRDAGGKSLAGVLAAGGTHAGAFARLLGLSLALLGLGAFGAGALFDRLERAGVRAHDTLLSMYVTLPLAKGALLALWAALVAGFQLLARALTVADGRRVVLRTALLALRALARRPLPLVAYMALTISLQLLSGLVLAAVRLPLSPGAQVGVRLSLMVLVLGLHASVWLLLLERARALCDHPRLADLRERPDAPFGVLPGLRALLARLRRRPSRRPPARPPDDMLPPTTAGAQPSPSPSPSNSARADVPPGEG